MPTYQSSEGMRQVDSMQNPQTLHFIVLLIIALSHAQTASCNDASVGQVQYWNWIRVPNLAATYANLAKDLCCHGRTATS
jgi:hypothetical protein